jgi:general secretion pathway protein A
LYVNAAYNQTYITLLASIRERKGLTVLTGESGTGKTTLLHLLTASLDDTVSVVFLQQLPRTFAEFVVTLCNQLSLRSREDSMTARLELIEDHLRARAFRGETTALVVDNAHTLDQLTLNHLQTLLDFQGLHGNLLSLILAGHQQLGMTFAQPEMQTFARRIAVHCHLSPLPEEDVEAFIRYRLQTAGWTQQYLFSLAAVARIARHSRGVPQHINTICDKTLRAAYASGRKIISSQLVDEVMSKLQLRQEKTMTDTPPFQPTTTLPIERLGFPPTRQSWRALQRLRTRLVRIGKKMIAVGLAAFLLFASLVAWNQVSSSSRDGFFSRIRTALPSRILWPALPREIKSIPPPSSPKPQPHPSGQRKRSQTLLPAAGIPPSLRIGDAPTGREAHSFIKNA